MLTVFASEDWGDRYPTSHLATRAVPDGLRLRIIDVEGHERNVAHEDGSLMLTSAFAASPPNC